MNRGVSRYPKLNDAAWLRQQYVKLGSGANSIANQLGCSSNTVLQALRRHGITVRPGTVPFLLGAWTDGDLLSAISEAGTIKEFASRQSTSQCVVAAEMRRRGLALSDVQDVNQRSCRSRTCTMTDAQIEDAAKRRASGESTDSIADDMRVSPSTVRRTLRLYAAR